MIHPFPTLNVSRFVKLNEPNNIWRETNADFNGPCIAIAIACPAGT